MNCKIKAATFGAFWALGLLVALAVLLGVLTGLFMLGDAYGVPVAGFVSMAGFGIASGMAARAGYDHYMKNCKEKSE